MNNYPLARISGCVGPTGPAVRDSEDEPSHKTSHPTVVIKLRKPEFDGNSPAGRSLSKALTDPSDSRVTSGQYCHVSSTTSRFDFSIRLLVQSVARRCKYFIVGTLTYNLLEYWIFVSQVRYMGIGNFSTIVPFAGTTSQYVIVFDP